MMKQLLPHQIEDAAFLSSRPFAGNFSGMGSGKTLTALEALKQVDDGDGYVLIVGPPISLSMWKEEAEEHLGMPAQIVRTGTAKLNFPNTPIFIMSYQIATKRRDELKKFNILALICDESHALKSPKAKRTKAIIGRGGICESAKYTWCLSGTPSTRYHDDMFTFLARADNRGLKALTGKVSLDRFRLRYCITQKKKFSAAQRFPTEITVGNRNTEELNEFIFGGGLAVRRSLDSVWAEMPPLTINRLQVQLDRDAELTAMLKELNAKTIDQVVMDMASPSEHLSTLRRKLGMAKVKHSVSEIVDRIQAGISPILVGAWHTSVIDELTEVLQEKGIDARKLDGRTTHIARLTLTKAFNAQDLQVLVGQISAMGTSLNLQGGSHIICVEEDWSPALMDQFFARCHRIGQANHVHVDIFESDTPLDRAVRKINAAKTRGHHALMAQEEA